MHGNAGLVTLCCRNCDKLQLDMRLALTRIYLFICITNKDTCLQCGHTVKMLALQQLQFVFESILLFIHKLSLNAKENTGNKEKRKKTHL